MCRREEKAEGSRRASNRGAHDLRAGLVQKLSRSSDSLRSIMRLPPFYMEMQMFMGMREIINPGRQLVTQIVGFEEEGVLSSVLVEGVGDHVKRLHRSRR